MEIGADWFFGNVELCRAASARLRERERERDIPLFTDFLRDFAIDYSQLTIIDDEHFESDREMEKETDNDKEKEKERATLTHTHTRTGMHTLKALYFGEIVTAELWAFVHVQEQVDLLVDLSVRRTLPREHFAALQGVGYLPWNNTSHVIVLKSCVDVRWRDCAQSEISWSRRLRLAWSLTAALHHLHSRNISMRDFSPSKVFVGPRDSVCFVGQFELNAAGFTESANVSRRRQSLVAMSGYNRDVYVYGRLLSMLIRHPPRSLLTTNGSGKECFGRERSLSSERRRPTGSTRREGEQGEDREGEVRAGCPERLQAVVEWCTDEEPMLLPTMRDCRQEMETICREIIAEMERERETERENDYNDVVLETEERENDHEFVEQKEDNEPPPPPPDFPASTPPPVPPRAPPHSLSPSLSRGAFPSPTHTERRAALLSLNRKASQLSQQSAAPVDRQSLSLAVLRDTQQGLDSLDLALTEYVTSLRDPSSVISLSLAENALLGDACAAEREGEAEEEEEGENDATPDRSVRGFHALEEFLSLRERLAHIEMLINNVATLAFSSSVQRFLRRSLGEELSEATQREKEKTREKERELCDAHTQTERERQKELRERDTQTERENALRSASSQTERARAMSAAHTQTAERVLRVTHTQTERESAREACVQTTRESAAERDTQTDELPQEKETEKDSMHAHSITVDTHTARERQRETGTNTRTHTLSSREPSRERQTHSDTLADTHTDTHKQSERRPSVAERYLSAVSSRSRSPSLSRSRAVSLDEQEPTQSQERPHTTTHTDTHTDREAERGRGRERERETDRERERDRPRSLSRVALAVQSIDSRARESVRDKERVSRPHTPSRTVSRDRDRDRDRENSTDRSLSSTAETQTQTTPTPAQPAVSHAHTHNISTQVTPTQTPPRSLPQTHTLLLSQAEREKDTPTHLETPHNAYTQQQSSHTPLTSHSRITQHTQHTPLSHTRSSVEETESNGGDDVSVSLSVSSMPTFASKSPSLSRRSLAPTHTVRPVSVDEIAIGDKETPRARLVYDRERDKARDRDRDDRESEREREKELSVSLAHSPPQLLRRSTSAPLSSPLFTHNHNNHNHMLSHTDTGANAYTDTNTGTYTGTGTSTAAALSSSSQSAHHALQDSTSAFLENIRKLDSLYSPLTQRSSLSNNAQSSFNAHTNTPRFAQNLQESALTSSSHSLSPSHSPPAHNTASSAASYSSWERERERERDAYGDRESERERTASFSLSSSYSTRALPPRPSSYTHAQNHTPSYPQTNTQLPPHTPPYTQSYAQPYTQPQRPTYTQPYAQSQAEPTREKNVQLNQALSSFLQIVQRCHDTSSRAKQLVENMDKRISATQASPSPPLVRARSFSPEKDRQRRSLSPSPPDNNSSPRQGSRLLGRSASSQMLLPQMEANNALSSSSAVSFSSSRRRPVNALSTQTYTGRASSPQERAQAAEESRKKAAQQAKDMKKNTINTSYILSHERNTVSYSISPKPSSSSAKSTSRLVWN